MDDTDEPAAHEVRVDRRPVRASTGVGTAGAQQLRLLPEPDETDEAIRILTEAFPGAQWIE